jgi:hypothetical protein
MYGLAYYIVEQGALWRVEGGRGGSRTDRGGGKRRLFDNLLYNPSLVTVTVVTGGLYSRFPIACELREVSKAGPF